MSPSADGALSDGSTKDDLRDMRDQILGEMRTGFDRTHARLDVLNGRVAKNETEIVKHAERIRTLFARLVERRQRDRRDEEGETEKRPITRRDVALVVGGGAGLVAALKLLVWIGPALKAFAP